MNTEKEDKDINLFKIKKIKDYADFIEKEIQNDLSINMLLIDEMIGLLLEIKAGEKNARV